MSLMVLLGGRFLAKGARFHYLEREHFAAVVQMKLEMQRAASGETVGKNELTKLLERGQWVASQVDVELFTIRQGLFRLLGFNGIINFPAKDLCDLEQIRMTAQAAAGKDLNPALVKLLQPELAKVQENTDRFGPLVAEAVGFVKALVVGIKLLGGVALFPAFWVIH